MQRHSLRVLFGLWSNAFLRKVSIDILKVIALLMYGFPPMFSTLEALLHFSVGIRGEQPALPGSCSHQLWQGLISVSHGWLYFTLPCDSHSPQCPHYCRTWHMTFNLSLYSFSKKAWATCPQGWVLTSVLKDCVQRKQGALGPHGFSLAFSGLLVNPVTVITSLIFASYHKLSKDWKILSKENKTLLSQG